MKTGIKMRVNKEQSRKIQQISFANEVYWDSSTSVHNTEEPYLYIGNRITYGTTVTGFQNSDKIEVDPEFFIRTNGTCEEDGLNRESTISKMEIVQNEGWLGAKRKEEFPPFEDIGTYCGAENLLALNFDSPEQEYEVYKAAYKDGANITWQLKQKDQRSELRREFEDARERGEIVVRLSANKGVDNYIVCSDNYGWYSDIDYKLVYYKFNPVKALAWSYREGGVFIECVFAGLGEGFDLTGYLISSPGEHRGPNSNLNTFEACRLIIDKEGNVNLSNGTTINIYKDGLIEEWFDEIN
jgi:hypothetical protein